MELKIGLAIKKQKSLLKKITFIQKQNGMILKSIINCLKIFQEILMEFTIGIMFGLIGKISLARKKI
jgi:hypothetical protein